MRKIAIAPISSIPMYHGTGAIFEEFAGMVWATPSRDLAEQYGSNVKEVRLDIRRPFNADLGLGINVSFINLLTEAFEQTPLPISDELIDKTRSLLGESSYDTVRKYEHWEKPQAAAKTKQLLLMLGFDGIMYLEAPQGGQRGTQTYAALDASQVTVVG